MPGSGRSERHHTPQLTGFRVSGVTEPAVGISGAGAILGRHALVIVVIVSCLALPAQPWDVQQQAGVSVSFTTLLRTHP